MSKVVEEIIVTLKIEIPYDTEEIEPTMEYQPPTLYIGKKAARELYNALDDYFRHDLPVMQARKCDDGLLDLS